MLTPYQYKTQSGLIKALCLASEKTMDSRLSWWFQNAKNCLIEKWQWDERQASKYVAGFMPTKSKYIV